MRNKFKAFTLAEVLITLGIIGIVAALTLPSLIANHRIKVLKTQFEKSYAVMSQAFLFALNESQLNIRDIVVYDSSHSIIGETCKYSGGNPGYGYYDACIFVNHFLDKLKVLGYVPEATLKKIKTYDGSTERFAYYSDFPSPNILLADGTSVRVMVNTISLWVDVDINGPNRGPNRLGFDIFRFYASASTGNRLLPLKMTKLYTEEELKNSSSPHFSGLPCSANSSQASNGVGCAYYAFNDISPDDGTKGYWESLPK